MKAIKLIALCAATAAILCSCAGKSAKGTQPKGITNEELKNASYMIGYNFGQILKGNNFGPMDMAQINKGIKDACADVELDQEVFYETINGFLEKRNTALKEENEVKSTKFLEKNALEEGVVTTESGLQYKIVRTGNGVTPTALTDKVEVNYEGKNLDGEVFDSSYDRGESVTFGLNQVIKGWGEGLMHCEEGGEILLWIPADLAYGDRGAGEKIQPGAAIHFRVELIKVVKEEAETK
ncbi:MAG: FKBP-type peptidyl-prolyl cis-trans isomerase [Bacteroidales bacterium]|jgi:FKBP-type peptidyl-prolyl cis-trans isomerase|nr:FKBP-type peptidyl-prolyl cis-trans isomerase [Bacteroidales bacterium]